MTTIDLSAPVQPRSGAGGGLGKGGAESGAGGGSPFDGALRDLAERDLAERGRGAAGRQPSGEAPIAQPSREPQTRSGQGAGEGGGDAGEASDEARLASLLRERPRSMPIRPGALALAAPPPQPQAQPSGEEAPAQALLAAFGFAVRVEAAEKGTPKDALRGTAQGGTRAIGEGAALANEAGEDTADADAPRPERAPRRPQAPSFASTHDLHLSTRIEATPRRALEATIVSQATHLPPALGAQNLQALVDGALSLLAREDAPGRGALAFERHLAATGTLAKGASPVKVLTVQLQPVSLGTVTIALRMTGDGVAMEITAADAKAAAMLKQDESRIVDAVRRSGLAGEVVAIHTADAGSSGPRGAGEGPAGGAKSGAEAGGGAEAGQGRERKGGSGGEPGQRRMQDVEAGTREDRGGNRPDGGLYL